MMADDYVQAPFARGAELSFSLHRFVKAFGLKLVQS